MIYADRTIIDKDFLQKPIMNMLFEGQLLFDPENNKPYIVKRNDLGEFEIVLVEELNSNTPGNIGDFINI